MFSYIVSGIIIGWLIPRPAIIGRLEARLWAPLKRCLPDSILKHFGQKGNYTMIEFFLWQGLAMTAVIVTSFVAGYVTKSILSKSRNR